MPLPARWQSALGPAARDALSSAEAQAATRQAAGAAVYPPAPLRYRALELVNPEDVRVVIVGQDPYHGEGQAMGLAFSVPRGVRIPPSLANIYKELGTDVGLARPIHGDLTAWARQGVLLLNTALSVEAGEAGSHAKIGWDPVTKAVLKAASDASPGAAFLLWGNYARALAPLADPAKHLVLQCAHPSPLSARNFLGCRHFSRANAFLAARGRGKVDWDPGA